MLSLVIRMKCGTLAYSARGASQFVHQEFSSILAAASIILSNAIHLLYSPSCHSNPLMLFACYFLLGFPSVCVPPSVLCTCYLGHTYLFCNSSVTFYIFDTYLTPVYKTPYVFGSYEWCDAPKQLLTYILLRE